MIIVLINLLQLTLRRLTDLCLRLSSSSSSSEKEEPQQKKEENTKKIHRELLTVLNTITEHDRL